MSIRLAPGTLWEAARRRAAAALASGALQPIASGSELLEADGVRFGVRTLEGAAALDRAAAAQRGGDPFRDPDPRLRVVEVSDSHVCLLNKFPVLGGHLLIVTRDAAEQESALDAADFEALSACLVEGAALGFYNAGAAAGASQPHRHLQLVRLPLFPGVEAVPVEPLLRPALPERGVGRAPALPFEHALAHTPEDPAAAHALHRSMLAATGASAAPYNLLVTRAWTLLVPRTRASFEGIEVNALGYAGALLVRGREALARLRRIGPLALLAAVGVSREAPRSARYPSGPTEVPA